MNKDFDVFWNSLSPSWQADIKHGLGNAYSLRGKVPASFEELAQIKTISVSQGDLSVLLYCKNLTKLAAPKVEIEDTAQIAALSTLQELSLTNSSLRDLSFLPSLQALTKLTISRTKAADLEALTTLPKLANLDVSYTGIKNWEPLRWCKKLRALYANACPHFAPHQVERLREIKILSIKDNQLENLDFLKNLQKLECLWLQNTKRGVPLPSCQSGDLSVLKTLPHLRQVGCSPTEFEEIQFWFSQTMHFDVQGKEYVVENGKQYSLVAYNALQKAK